jgi:prevent-host-death family protein
MTPISLKEVRKRLGELVAAAERGESITITRHGKEVARLVPVGAKARAPLPDLTEFRASLKVSGKPLSEVLREARDQERS